MGTKLKMIVAAVAVALESYQRRWGLAPSALALEITKEEHGKLSKDLQALYKESDGKYALELPDGVEQVGGLKSALEKERKRANDLDKAVKDLTKRFEGIDPDQVRKLLEKIDGDEEGALIKAGKIDEVVSKRMAKANAAHERALQEAQKKIDAANERAEKFSQRVLDNHIRASASKAGLHPHAIEDALFRARTIFKLDDEGNAVQLDADGKPVLGKDSKTPFSPDEWIAGMKETAPHWFPQGSSGGGAGGDRGGKGGGKTMKRAEFDKLDPVAKSTAVKEKVQIVD